MFDSMLEKVPCGSFSAAFKQTVALRVSRDDKVMHPPHTRPGAQVLTTDRQVIAMPLSCKKIPRPNDLCADHSAGCLQSGRDSMFRRLTQAGFPLL